MNPSLRRVLDLIRTNSQSESDKGTRFEHLMKRYLETDPVYRDRFSHVWRWVDWPYRGGLADQGVDLVAQEAATGDYVAIQCKCYEETHTLNLADVGTFFTTLGMLWKTEQGTLPFARGIIIATTDRWNDKLLNTMGKQARPCQRIALSNLEEADKVGFGNPFGLGVALGSIHVKFFVDIHSCSWLESGLLAALRQVNLESVRENES